MAERLFGLVTEYALTALRRKGARFESARAGLLTSPLRERFGVLARLEFYPPDDLKRIVKRSASLLGIEIDEEGAMEIARRSRGTPRVANRLLRRVRDFAQVAGSGSVDITSAKEALARLEVDERGLDSMDKKILLTLIDKFGGGPTGLDTIAAAIAEEGDTVEDVYEPFLIQEGLIERTPRGRFATAAAYEHYGRRKDGMQGRLL